MMAADPLAQGVELMLVGMGTVFVFLSALVAATTMMSRAVMRWAAPPATPADGDAETVAAITAAIAMHRRRRG